MNECKTCRFYYTYFDEAVSGFCRKNPPVVISRPDLEDGQSTHWPEVEESEWCGSYKAEALAEKDRGIDEK